MIFSAASTYSAFSALRLSLPQRAIDTQRAAEKLIRSRSGERLRSACASNRVAKYEAHRQDHKHHDRHHHDHSAKEEDKHSRREFQTVGNSVTQSATEPCRAYRDHFWCVNVYCDCREARAVFEKAFATFELFDVGPDVGDLSLNFERLFDAVGLLHDFEKLIFESFLCLDARFEIDEVFGDVLTGNVFCGQVAGQLLDLVERGRRISRREFGPPA